MPIRACVIIFSDGSVPGCESRDYLVLPEISAHLLAASPTCHYQEYVDWADAILEEPLQIQDGLARVRDRPGIGLTWRSEAMKALSLGPLIGHLNTQFLAEQLPVLPGR